MVLGKKMEPKVNANCREFFFFVKLCFGVGFFSVVNFLLFLRLLGGSEIVKCKRGFRSVKIFLRRVWGLFFLVVVTVAIIYSTIESF